MWNLAQLMEFLKKDFVRNLSSKLCLGLIFKGSFGLFLLSTCLLAQAQESKETSSSLSSASSVLTVFMSLLLVIAIIFALAFIMRRFNVAQAGGGQMRVVASMMAGSKEKIMVIQVGDEQHLVGVTSHNINHLAKLEQALDANSATNHSQTNSSQLNFQQKLVQAMASSITGKSNSAVKESKDA
jgi:flagellar protein FliO/FliZ